MIKEKQPIADIVDKEVQFWINYIAWWEAKYNKPATPRMLDALGSARKKQSEYLAS